MKFTDSKVYTLYLLPQNSLWALPDNSIILTRTAPFSAITKEEYESMSQQSKTVIDMSLSIGEIIALPGEDYKTKDQELIMVSNTFSQDMIQRRFSSAFIESRDISSVKRLIELELAKAAPRKGLISILKYSTEVIERLTADHTRKEPKVLSGKTFDEEFEEINI